ncbi:F0F1 ATP synthase subunit gamma [Carbonactinospora thermoautotrophica]|uniref:ATP synthase gamma chain n=1 Tax=Carbonactinospora thermoautotrophica TaxID=1469144 RepID=A0A132MQ15_9ACTN|nr:F0F1 ATP synthase subunit gamma [Carbonactinospora thermoautotrophica]KWW99521.1 ATP synthase gamma chain [Carbonactinospora thermoautotrophica]KWX04076.1 ATP synthase F0F1 subunit gamma [Carbonactinospora thermoautotrophica]KWX06829.1 ATP synthase F0F1 subunit gamma [Carbonactinospora thermoautotrophica]MCX9191898.1 F0F1 ATP synthase subunit gamma [Carbonactinospora thermoautotrophica]
MGAQLRVYRRRIRSVQAIKKITRAMELIAASRIVKAQQRVAASTPYAEALTRALSAAASNATVDHPLTTENPNPTRAAVVIVTSDRGLAGAYSANALKEGEALAGLLRSQGKEVVPYLVGRKGISYYRFRNRQIAGEWSGFSEKPAYADAKRIADTLIEAFLTPTAEGGVDEIHIVYTHFVNAITQRPVARRILPLEVEESTEEPPGGAFPLYDFEPSAEEVLDALLPRYVESRIYNALLQASASEFAARRRAMKAATDNAEELIRSYTRLANAARQAEITQEISEIVGGANALAEASAGSE